MRVKTRQTNECGPYITVVDVDLTTVAKESLVFIVYISNTRLTPLFICVSLDTPLLPNGSKIICFNCK